MMWLAVYIVAVRSPGAERAERPKHSSSAVTANPPQLVTIHFSPK